MGLLDQARDALKSAQAEGVSDRVLDKAADIVSERTGGSHDEAIKNIRDAADKQLGNE